MSDTSHYLVRIYKTISHGFQFGQAPDNTYHPDLSNYSYEINYTDHLISVPTTTVSLTETINNLIQAEALLCVYVSIYFVAMWQVSEDKGIDHLTPTLLFHPFGDWRLESTKRWDQSKISQLATLQNQNVRIQESLGVADNYGVGFRCYDIRANGEGFSSNLSGVDAYHVVSMSRQCETGRCQKQFISNAVQSLDFYWGYSDTLKMRTDTPLWLMRWPLWSQVMKRDKWQHVGFKVDRFGALSPRPVAQSNRVPAGVTSMQKKRKIAARRAASVGLVNLCWFNTVRAVMSWLHDNEGYGYVVPRLVAAGTSTFSPNYYSWVDAFGVKECLKLVARFINFVGNSTGNTYPICVQPNEDSFGRNIRWTDPKAIYGGPANMYLQFRQTDEGTNHLIFDQLIRHWYYVTTVLRDTWSAFITVEGSTKRTHSDQFFSWINDYQNVADARLLKWVSVQQSMYAISQLLLSWQHSFMPIEQTRGTSKSVAMFHHKRLRWPESDYVEGFAYREAIYKSPNLLGRYTYDSPQFTNFRIWNAPPIDRSLTQSQRTAAENARTSSALTEKQRRELEDQARRIQRQLFMEERTREELINWDANNTSWFELQDAFTDPTSVAWQNMYQEGMDEDLRTYAEGAVSRMGNLWNQLDAIHRRLTADGNAAPLEGDTYNEVLPQFVLPPTVYPLPTWGRWVMTSVDGSMVHKWQVFNNSVATYTDRPFVASITAPTDNNIWGVLLPRYDSVGF